MSYDDERPRGRIRTWAYRIAIALVVLAIITTAILRGAWHHNLEEKLAELGFPAEAAPMHSPFPAVPAGENAAPKLEEAMKSFATFPPTAHDSLSLLGMTSGPNSGPDAHPLSQPFPEEALAEYDAHLLKNWGTLTHALDALDIPGCQWPATPGGGYSLDHLTLTSNLSYTLACMAIVNIEERNSEGTGKAILGLMKLGDALRKDTNCTTQLRGMSYRWTALLLLRRAMYYDVVREEDLAGASALLDDASDSLIDEFRRSMVYQVQRTQVLLRRSSKRHAYQMHDREERIRAFLSDMIGLHDLEAAYYLDMMTPFFEAARQEPRGFVCMAPILTTQFRASVNGIPLYCVYLPHVIESWQYQVQSRANHLEYLNLVQTALAVERCRLRTGSLPESLEALPDDLLAMTRADLYTDKPFIYRPSGDGFVVFSPGPQGTFDPQTVEWDETTTLCYVVYRQPDPEEPEQEAITQPRTDGDE